MSPWKDFLRKIPAWRVASLMRRLGGTPVVALEDLDPAAYPVKPTYDAAEHYHQEARWWCGLHGWRSMVDVSVDPVVEALLAKAHTAAAKRDVLRRYGYSAAHWSPALAAAFYRSLGAKRVLDPCAGWGDRLAAALALPEVEVYHGWDPNRATRAGYIRQILDWGNGRPFRVHCQPFEDADVAEGFYDLALTSPPYWKREHYSIDPEQSYLRYDTLDAWVRGFLQPMMTKAVAAVRPGGHFVLNIANVLLDGEVARLTDRAQAVACALPLTLRCTKHLSFLASRSAFSKTEPIFVWRKDDVR